MSMIKNPWVMALGFQCVTTGMALVTRWHAAEVSAFWLGFWTAILVTRTH